MKAPPKKPSFPHDSTLLSINVDISITTYLKKKMIQVMVQLNGKCSIFFLSANFNKIIIRYLIQHFFFTLRKLLTFKVRHFKDFFWHSEITFTLFLILYRADIYTKRCQICYTTINIFLISCNQYDGKNRHKVAQILSSELHLLIFLFFVGGPQQHIAHIQQPDQSIGLIFQEIF